MCMDFSSSLAWMQVLTTAVQMRADRAVSVQDDRWRSPDEEPRLSTALETHCPRLLLVDGLLVRLQHLLQRQLPDLSSPRGVSVLTAAVGRSGHAYSVLGSSSSVSVDAVMTLRFIPGTRPVSEVASPRAEERRRTALVMMAQLE